MKKELANADSVIDMQLYNQVSGEHRVQLSNSQPLVVNLTSRKCSCRWWQIQGFSYRYAMAVIKKEKKWGYHFVNVCYKTSTQRICYMNSVHPMKRHDMATVDDRTECVIGSDALDHEFNRCISPPINPPK